MKYLHWFAAASAMVSTSAEADTVCEWVDFAHAVQAAAAPPPNAPRTPDHERAQTQVALAMFEALNAIDRRYESYLGFAQGDPKIPGRPACGRDPEHERETR